MDEELILNNQSAIMWALRVDMPDHEIKEDLERQIKLSEDRNSIIKQLKG